MLQNGAEKAVTLEQNIAKHPSNCTAHLDKLSRSISILVQLLLATGASQPDTSYALVLFARALPGQGFKEQVMPSLLGAGVNY